MLSPKKVKWRKPHKGMTKGKAKRGQKVSFGEYGLQALEAGWVTAQQIEACRVSITRKMKRGGKVWIRVFPHLAFTKKPAETRMGKGKGSPEGWVAVVKPGRVVFEVGGVTDEIAHDALRLASHKLGIKTRIVTKDIVGGV